MRIRFFASFHYLVRGNGLTSSSVARFFFPAPHIFLDHSAVRIAPGLQSIHDGKKNVLEVVVVVVDVIGKNLPIGLSFENFLNLKLSSLAATWFFPESTIVDYDNNL